MTTASALDPEKLHAFLGSMVGDIGAAFTALLVDIGDKLGLYKAMAEAGPLSSEELAKRTATSERYVREWLANQVASGYVNYDSATQQYAISPEQAFALADEGSAAFLPGIYQILASVFRDEAKLIDAFRTGNGIGWHEHDLELFEGTERFFRPGYNANLVSTWIPALEAVEAKLQAGASVADVGCGHGASTIIWPRRIQTPASSGLIIIRLPSRLPGSARKRPASAIA